MPAPSDATSLADAQKRAPADHKAVIEFLRGKNGPKVRRGVLNGKRVDFFKGKTAVRTLMGPAYQKLGKKVPPVTSEEEAAALITKCLPYAYFLRVDRLNPNPPIPSGMPKPLNLSQQQQFDSAGYYSWFYEGSPFWNIVGGIAMVAVMLAGVMFPLWPVKLRIGVWYLSVGALGLVGLFIVIAIIRLILWCITKVSMAKAIWIFPNLFEDVGFVDSFIPAWEWDEPKKKRLRKVGEKRKRKEKDVTEEKAPAAAAPPSAIPSAIGSADPAAAAAEAARAPTPGNADTASGVASSPAAPTAAAASTATTTATAPPATNPTPRSRKAATVEEIEDE
ncbi:hypothetical protein CcaverHIS002_0202760 [Cutaneotrichosporon cavernicola]|uniref:Translocation protein SEC62 n=1 Tax=Cutaneotrichosporon cavernicola TaxID=279322 RepID=A0AA48I0E5_9TREE|nr:uncharacterized protein CcaverHIS019_0202760 [Cutaneotrichosporon cavernicola]BEI81116.1 hypothetical protein CcaverHIS002_0202760 [Cutaneotrichosporon cavernicola]BEI88914.1 hypothetical protein CcaverHIS019_0202760 [Cutaneotrichosporon cavernicola]BEI96691.1 hypothetical protein CcaverHIS631_0202800 [Cutaneotrichosporon cavernicola]BEJ04463.1 hypothetical protein CcaverHIS641_0202800 [Cutaneotrichosporon cavernicola]